MKSHTAANGGLGPFEVDESPTAVRVDPPVNHAVGT